jgi:amino acid adenylation domain-containing protein
VNNKIEVSAATKNTAFFRQWNKPNIQYPKNSTIAELFEQQVKLHPESIALRYQNISLSYIELNRRVNQTALMLKRHGVKEGNMVGICLERSTELVIHLIAIIKLGAIYVPLDANYPASRLHLIVSEAQLTLLISASSLIETLPALDVDIIDINEDEYHQQCSQVSGDNFKVIKASGENSLMAYVNFTSGTTGQPKGVLISQKGVVRLVKNNIFAPFNNNTCMVFMSTMTFDAATIEIWGPLLNGGCVYIYCGAQFDVELLIEELTWHKVNTIFITSALFQYLVLSNNIDFQGIKYMMTGGEVTSVKAVRKLYECNNDIEIINVYGPTENTTFSTFYTVPRDFDDTQPISIGSPLANSQCYVVDTQGYPVGIEEKGELVVTGDGLAQEYINNPKATNASFVISEKLTGTPLRSYHTGDFVRLEKNGFLSFIGRIDNQIKLRGYRIDLTEIKQTLTSLLVVREAMVLLTEDRTGDKKICAYIIIDEDYRISGLTEHQQQLKISQQLGEQLPVFMLPSAIFLMTDFPINENGKVDGKMLASMPIKNTVYRELIKPQNETQQQLLTYWQEVIGTDNLSIDDNFLDVGGQSLKAAKIVSMIRHTLGCDLTVSQFISYQTILQQANFIATLPHNENVDMIIPIVNKKICALSFSQQRLWFIDSMGGDKSLYNIPYLYKIKGSLDIDVLTQSFNTLISRHHILATRYYESEGNVYQQKIADSDFEITQIDALTFSPEALEHAILTETERKIDLGKVQSLRCHLFHLADKENLLLINIHHIATDGWSMAIIFEELNKLYNHNLSNPNESCPLAPLTIQYTDYAIWQKSIAFENSMIKDITYWEQHLQQLPVLHDLPTSYPRPAQQSYKGSRLHCKISNEVVDKLLRLGQQHNVTLYMVLQSAFSLLLSRYSGETDIVMGTPDSGRLNQQINSLIGFFVNTLVIRNDVSGNPDFNQFLLKNSKTILDAFDHGKVPFDRLVETIKPQRNTSFQPLFQIMFVLQNNQPCQLDLQGTETRELKHDSRNAKFDLLLEIEQDEEQLSCCWEFASSLFSEEFIEQMAGHYINLLTAIVLDPQVGIKDYNFMDPIEIQQQQFGWNSNKSIYSTNKLIHQCFEQQVSEHPHQLALDYVDANLSYRELNQKANQFARLLIEQGVFPGDEVGFILSPTSHSIIAMLGILKTGATYVPIDAKYPAQRIDYMLKDAGLSLLLVDKKHKRIALSTRVKILCIDEPEIEIIYSRLAQDNITIEMTASERHPAYMIYTSGSTGKPKGIVVSHKNVVSLVCNNNYVTLGSDNNIAQASSLSFDAATFEVWGALLNGARLTQVNKDTLLSPLDLQQHINHKKIDTLFITTALFNRIAIEAPDCFLHCKHVLFGGEEVSQSAVKQVITQGKPYKLIHVYGPTENTTFSTFCILDESYATKNCVIPIGRPLANRTAYVVDSQIKPTPVGVVGELLLGGDGIALGYHNRQELTNEKFIDDTFSGSTGQKLYRSGDLVRYLADGNIEFIGRVDDQVKIRGLRIELGEIQEVLEQCDNVDEVFVTVQERKESDKLLLAYLVMTNKISNEALQRQEILDKINEKLPGFMVPSSLNFIDKLPLNHNGKVDKKALPEPIFSQKNLTKADNEQEVQLLAIFKAVLNLDAFGVEDSFFDCGGHSLLAIKLLSIINKTQQCQLRMSDLFSAPTVRQLLQHSNASLNRYLLSLNTQGEGDAIFIVPGGGGMGSYLYDFALTFKGVRPVYSFQAVGLEGEAPAHLTVEEMATFNLSLIKDTIGEKPFFLAGHSLGCAVIYEMNQQLKKQGKALPLLIMLDGGELEGGELTDESALKHMATNLSFLAGENSELSNEDFPGVDWQAKLKNAYTLIRERKWLDENISVTNFENMVTIYRLHVAWEYRLSTKNACQIGLFYTQEIEDYRKMKEYPQLLPSWQNSSIKPVWAAKLDAGHIEMIKQPYVKKLMIQIEQWIKEINPGD